MRCATKLPNTDSSRQLLRDHQQRRRDLIDALTKGGSFTDALVMTRTRTSQLLYRR